MFLKHILSLFFVGSISSRLWGVVVYPPPDERLDHWSVSLVHDVTSAISTNYYAGIAAKKKLAEFVTPKTIKRVIAKMCSM